MTPELLAITDDLVSDLSRLSFGPPVTHVYDPLVYARPAWDDYVRRFAATPKEVVLVGMNPGPWGMAQTGIPFGAVSAVRWMGIAAEVGRPGREHPKRPVAGLACAREEVSGARLWGWARDAFGTPEAFFRRFFVANWCPLSFLEESGRNRTPDQLPASERAPLCAACDRALRRTVEVLRPHLVVGVGRFAADRARIALDGLEVRIGCVPHPSPASPAANRGWREAAERELRALGVRL
ncbi:MAG: single-stranded DNA-binding protein [Deltaproteobacteria bacterium]|nr:single-stranded DNA-binding protein [Deltaproteobacteria bacterium]